MGAGMEWMKGLKIMNNPHARLIFLVMASLCPDIRQHFNTARLTVPAPRFSPLSRPYAPNEGLSHGYNNRAHHVHASCTRRVHSFAPPRYPARKKGLLRPPGRFY